MNCDKTNAIILSAGSFVGFLGLEVTKQLAEDFPVSFFKGISIALCAGGLVGLPVTRNRPSKDVPLLRYMYVASIISAAIFTANADISKISTIAELILGSLVGAAALSLFPFYERGNVNVGFDTEIRSLPMLFAATIPFVVGAIATGKRCSMDETEITRKVFSALIGGAGGAMTVGMGMSSILITYLFIRFVEEAARSHRS